MKARLPFAIALLIIAGTGTALATGNHDKKDFKPCKLEVTDSPRIHNKHCSTPTQSPKVTPTPTATPKSTPTSVSPKPVVTPKATPTPSASQTPAVKTTMPPTPLRTQSRRH
jgi:hypothetical protein